MSFNNTRFFNGWYNNAVERKTTDTIETEPKGKIKYVGFDKDGTLFDNMSAYARIWGEIFHKEYGIDPKEAGDFLIRTSGQATKIQVDTLLKEHGIFLSEDEVFRKANKIATALGERSHSEPFLEVPGILKKLKEAGYKIFVSSGQQERIVRKDLERTGLIQYVDFLAGIRPDKPEYKKGGPHFRAAAEHFGVPFEQFVKQAVFIGDTPTDLEVSKQVNIISIIRKSANASEKLLDEGASFFVEDFSNLPKLLGSI